MNRIRLIASIAALSFGAAACDSYGDRNAAYDGENAAYDEKNAAYDEQGNAAYGAENKTYEAPEGNAAYTPPADGNVSTNTGAPPPADPTRNGY